jgi:hypothetical protein
MAEWHSAFLAWTKGAIPSTAKTNAEALSLSDHNASLSLFCVRSRGLFHSLYQLLALQFLDAP